MSDVCVYRILSCSVELSALDCAPFPLPQDDPAVHSNKGTPVMSLPLSDRLPLLKLPAVLCDLPVGSDASHGHLYSAAPEGITSKFSLTASKRGVSSVMLGTFLTNLLIIHYRQG